MSIVGVTGALHLCYMATVKDLKQHLSKFSDDANVFITVWGENGPSNFEVRIPRGRILYPGIGKDEQWVIASHVDNCIADKVYQKPDGTIHKK